MFKQLTQWWTVLITVAAFGFLHVSNPDIIQSIEYAYYDALQQNKEKEIVEGIVLVNIDEKQSLPKVNILGLAVLLLSTLSLALLILYMY